MPMTLDEVRLSICYIIWHYRPELLPEFQEHTKPSYTIGHMADFLDRHFPLEGQSWGTHTIVLTPSELLHYIEKEQSDESRTSNDEGRYLSCRQA